MNRSQCSLKNMFSLSLRLWILLAVLLGCAASISTHDANSLHSNCECLPECLNEKQNCTNSRLVERDDCPCCKVCARQIGESCNVQNPCDRQANLICSSGATCEGESNQFIKIDLANKHFLIWGKTQKSFFFDSYES